MRILMVTRESHAEQRYGLGRSLRPVIEALGRRGIEARYLCRDDLPAATMAHRADWLRRICALPGVRGRPGRMALAGAWLERLHVGFCAARLAVAEGYSHVHLHDPWLALGAWFGLRGHKGTVPQWGLTQHGFGCYSMATHEDGLLQGARAQALFRRIEAWTLRKASWVVAPTQAALRQLARDLALPALPRHWHCVPHARPRVDARTDERRQRARALLGWDDNVVVVLGIGRLVPLKGFDRLVTACAGLRHPGLRLVLLGEGDNAGLQALADRLGFGAQLTMAVAEDVSPYLHAADIYVSTSSTESFGMANLEALCAGLPSICTAVGGVPEVVGDGAWLLPHEGPALAAALAALVEDEGLRDRWARRAEQRGSLWPSAQEVVEGYVEIYQTPRP